MWAFVDGENTTLFLCCNLIHRNHVIMQCVTKYWAFLPHLTCNFNRFYYNRFCLSSAITEI